MPVSAMLLTNPGGTHNHPPQFPRGNFAQAPFPRGEKATSSVKLRRKKEDGTRGKKNRHSGDFSFFSSKKMELADSDAANDLNGDFDYITFPNGVPCVTQLRVGANAPPPSDEPTTTKVIMRESNGRRNLESSRAVSASAVNVNDKSALLNFQQDVREQNLNLLIFIKNLNLFIIFNKNLNLLIFIKKD